jgi:hypothetical protein
MKTDVSLSCSHQQATVIQSDPHELAHTLIKYFLKFHFNIILSYEYISYVVSFLLVLLFWDMTQYSLVDYFLTFRRNILSASSELVYVGNDLAEFPLLYLQDGGSTFWRNFV